MSSKPKVCIVGSINMDLTVTTDKMPMQGETVLGDNFFTNPGGKGANQAVAASRMGADVTFIGAVGTDGFGDTLVRNLNNERIKTEGIEVVPESATGTATIILSGNDNRIIVASGANDDVTPDVVTKYRHLIQDSDIVLMQLEVPMSTIQMTCDVAHAKNVPVVLNPAPFQPLPEQVLNTAAYLTPNEIERTSLQNESLDCSIMEKSIVTLGKRGVQFYESGYEKNICGHRMNVADTTGAGDTFNGALAAELARGTEIEEAIRMANAAAALSVEKIGAHIGMPYKHEVNSFLKRR